MRKLIRKIRARLTRRNLVWFAKTNVTSWILQGTLYGLLTLAGVGTVGALVSAKATAYTVWFGQLLGAARAAE